MNAPARCPALLLATSLILAQPNVRAADPPTRAGWTLVWSDEFTTDGRPDPAKWGYEQGFIRNREAQYYRPENAWVEKGQLVIEARKEHLTGLPSRPGRGGRRPGGGVETHYTSASLITKGKAAWTEGRVEVRAKLPTGRGTWPAIWLLGTSIDQVGWPRCGEIDVMENVGFDPDTIHANIHTEKYNHVQKTGKGSQITVPRPSADFHVYAVEWDTETMDFSVDGTTYFTYRNEHTGKAAWPFNQPQYLILNLAIGGEWGGQKGIDDAIFPQRFVIESVHVYRKNRTPSR